MDSDTETDPEKVDILAFVTRLHRAAAGQAGLSIHQFVLLPGVPSQDADWKGIAPSVSRDGR
jgi:hypothetical protein